MKKIIMLLIIASIFGCASSNKRVTSTGEEYRYPNGKIHQQWIDDELYCRDKSGKITGLLGLTTYGWINNRGKVNDEYNSCMKDLGWGE